MERLLGLGILGVLSLATIVCATILSLHGNADVGAWLTLAGMGMGGIAGYLTGRDVGRGAVPKP